MEDIGISVSKEWDEAVSTFNEISSQPFASNASNDVKEGSSSTALLKQNQVEPTTTTTTTTLNEISPQSSDADDPQFTSEPLTQQPIVVGVQEQVPKPYESGYNEEKITIEEKNVNDENENFDDDDGWEKEEEEEAEEEILFGEHNTSADILTQVENEATAVKDLPKQNDTTNNENIMTHEKNTTDENENIDDNEGWDEEGVFLRKQEYETDTNIIPQEENEVTKLDELPLEPELASSMETPLQPVLADGLEQPVSEEVHETGTSEYCTNIDDNTDDNAAAGDDVHEAESDNEFKEGSVNTESDFNDDGESNGNENMIGGEAECSKSINEENTAEEDTMPEKLDRDDKVDIISKDHAPSTTLSKEQTAPRISSAKTHTPQIVQTNDNKQDIQPELEESSNISNEVTRAPQILETNNNAKEQHEKLAQQQLLQQQEQHKTQGQLQTQCEALQKDLATAHVLINSLKLEAAEREHQQKIRNELLSKQTRENEAKLLASAEQSAVEALKRETQTIRNSMERQCRFLETQLQKQQEESSATEEKLRKLLEEANKAASTLQSNQKVLLAKQEAHTLQQQKEFQKEINAAQEAVIRSQTVLDDKEEEVSQLHTVIKDLRATIAKIELSTEEAEEEMDDLHAENEELHKKVEVMQNEKLAMEKKMKAIQKDHANLEGMAMELHMLKETVERDRVIHETKNATANTDLTNLTSDRDEARAEVLDLKSRLAAALADLDIARTDADRATTASSNLQMALEAFQSEREAEMAMWEEQKRTSEEVEREKNRVAMEASKQENERIMQEVQMAANKAVKNSIEEIERTEHTVQQYRKDNANLRRSLDEAIHRLQTSQDDVVDRSLMKNILLDWHSKSGRARRDVMILMASVLHFTEDEKDKAGIGEGPGTIGKVVGAVTAPIPPPALNVDKIEGDSVREKWVNFLMAESGELPDQQGVAAAVATKTTAVSATETPNMAHGGNQSVS
uniref:GRIP domain-containing protein n=2 Tax=Ditylum brightwellii TaxID=49249 RepID=A0A7S4VKR7_9STRA